MARRNGKTEHKRRRGRGVARGLQRPTPRAPAAVRQARGRPLIEGRRIEDAILEMNRGRSMTAAARALHVSRHRLRDALVRRHLGKRRGRRWVVKDDRLRRVPVMTRGHVEKVTVRGYEPARLVGEHHQAAREFVSTNDVVLLQPFEGRTVQAANGRRYVLETDPNALHRIAAMDSPPFHEIYEITSNT